MVKTPKTCRLQAVLRQKHVIEISVNTFRIKETPRPTIRSCSFFFWKELFGIETEIDDLLIAKMSHLLAETKAILTNRYKENTL